ncbi:MAG: hypothetical protein Q9222_001151 [Ikaeria aurantiellina]
MSTEIQAEICNDCQQLFQDPENLQILCSDFSLHNQQAHTLSYTCKRRSLQAKASLGCLFCRKLVDYFRLDTDCWDEIQLGHPDGDADDIVFAICLLEMAPLVLSVSLEKVTEGQGNLIWLAFEFSNPLPTRVLDLSPTRKSGDVKLFESDVLPGNNLSALQKNIPLSSLSQSIQDSIQVVRQLGIRYLWVDALCIIQDAEEDKMHEIQRMDQIYSNAYLTIAAANSDNSSRGFLTAPEKWWSDTDGPQIRLPFLCPDWTVGSITLVKFGRPDFQEPLQRRSWPSQEYLLSPRVLLYGSEQLLWVCHEDSPNAIGATFKKGGPAYDSLEMGLKYMRMFLHRPKTISPGFARRNLWIDLVMEYSARQQTIPDDKIHALRGVATRYQTHIEDEYIAGLWKSWLIPGLLWRSLEPGRRRRERQYPSWSWLSIDGGVNMEKADDAIYGADRVAGFQFVEFNLDALGETTDPFGLLPHAVLHLRGRIKKLDTPILELFTIGFDKGRANFLRPQPTQIIMDALEDPPLNLSASCENEEGNLLFLPTIRVQIADQQADTYVGYAVQGPLLKQDPGAKTSRRVGWFISDVGKERDFVTGPAQDIYLV